MPTESLLLTVLFVLTAVAFSGVLNARGVWRTVVSAVLALSCLIATLWRVTEYRAERARALPPTAAIAEPNPEAPGRAATPAEAARASLLDALVDARSLHDALAGEEPGRARALPDSEYQAFERRARDHLSAARDLKERAQSLPEASGEPSATEPLRRAVAHLDDAAGALRAFFRAAGREEEEERARAFRESLDSAVAPLEEAESRGRPFPGL